MLKFLLHSALKHTILCSVDLGLYDRSGKTPSYKEIQVELMDRFVICDLLELRSITLMDGRLKMRTTKYRSSAPFTKDVHAFHAHYTCVHRLRLGHHASTNVL